VRRFLKDKRLWLVAAGMAVGGAAMVLGGCSCQGPAKRKLVVAEGIPVMRVKLGDEAPLVWVSCDGPCRLTAGSRLVAGGDKLERTRVRASAGGINVAGRDFDVEAVELRPAAGGTFTLLQTVGRADRRRTYRGWLKLLRTGPRSLRAVNYVGIEPYVAGVLPGEVPGRWHPEMFKAQAVAARTYALDKRRARQAQSFDVFDDQRSQVYRGAADESDKVWNAVAATRGLVGTYRASGGQRLLPMYYHSTCGGATSSPKIAFGEPGPKPLSGVECTYCRKSKYYSWEGVRISKREMTEALRRGGGRALERLGQIRRVEIAEKGPHGRAVTIRVTDAAGRRFRIDANQWRLWIGPSHVLSTRFTIRDEGSHVVLEGGGWGHGVGMCQYGGQYLATHGLTGEQILRYYYPGIVLSRAY
jgi:stage II sporulation protein D